VEEEIRFSLVMNGGVSLAVWIGGATAEIWRLVTTRQNARHPVYDGLLRITSNTVRVDVISGTSAGGINGAALALALVHETDFMDLRRVWTKVGDFRALLRRPMDLGNPGSILKGDDFFLPALQGAFKTLAGDGKKPRLEPDKLPIDLKLTATMLSGAQGRNVDDLGVDLHDVDYRAYFHFSRKNALGGDDFQGTDAVQKLAKAARSTASFPFAFEPSKVGPTKTSHLRTYSHDNMRQTRYVVDGGILDNKPFRGARDAIFDMPQKAKVRRIMAYMNPDPGDGPPFDFGEEKEAPMPAMSSVVAAAVIGIPTSQTIADQLLEIRKHNNEVRARRSNVQTLAVALAGTPQGLLELAARLYRSYRDRRLSAAFEQFVFEPLTLAASRDPRFAQLMKRFGRNTRDGMRRQFIRFEGNGWLPDDFNAQDPVGAKGSWGWGMFPVEFAITVAMNLLRLVQSVNESLMLPNVNVGDEWDRIYDCIRKIHTQRKRETRLWRWVVRAHLNALVLNPDQDILDWHKALYTRLFDVTRKSTRRSVCESVAGQVASVCATAARDAKRLATYAGDANNRQVVSRAEDRGEIEAMRCLAELLTADAAQLVVNAGVDQTLSILLAIEVVEFAFTDHQDMRSDTLIELVQISGNDESPLGGSGVAAQKLRGIQVAHFGAFYKSSWRANDWTYGRLDSSSRVVDILLNPARLFRQYKIGQPGRAQLLLDEIRSLALATDAESLQLQEQLRADWTAENCAAAITRELSFLDDANSQVPDSLPQCARVLKRRLHYEIAMEEMGHIAAAVETDQSEGALAAGPGHTLMCRLHRIRGIADVERGFALKGFDQLPVVSSPQTARELIGSGLLADESFLRTELGSDLMTKTFAHTMATTQSTLAGKSSKLGPVATFFKALQLPVFGFYIAATTLAKQSATAAAVIALLLGVGITLVIVSVASNDLPDAVGTLGWAALCAGVLMACAASKRTALWILIPLLLGMAAFALQVKNPSLWILVAVLVMALALFNRLQFPLALVALLSAGYYAHTKSGARLSDSPALVLSVIVVLALFVAYWHGTTRRRRDWRAVLEVALRELKKPPGGATATQRALASVGISALLGAGFLPMGEWALQAARASGISLIGFESPSLTVKMLSVIAVCLLLAIVSWLLLRAFKVMERIPQPYRGAWLFGLGVIAALLHWVARSLQFTVPAGVAPVPVAPIFLAFSVVLLATAVLRMCVGYGKGENTP
jgi:patatin-related protein